MNKLKNKVLKYLLNNEGKKILIDTKTEIQSDQIIGLAIGINKRKIVNKKIIINIERSADYIGLIWALWINGNTVIPTNKNWPKKYIKEIYKICNADLIINEKFYNELSVFKNKQDISTLKKKIQTLKKLKFNNNISYIIFTSGTTSKQKGVVISEKSYLAYINWTSKEFSAYKNLKSLILTSELNFDITFGDIAFALFSNCKIIVAKNNSNIFEIIQLIDKYNIEVMYTVPNLFKLLFLVLKKYTITKSIKLFISGGEALNKQICVDAKALFPKSNFYNVYGPTECTINITSYKVNLKNLKNKKVVPIGKVFSHLYWKILPTEKDRTIGELIVGGNQLMMGYVNTKFNFLKIKDKNYYNTGDLVKIDKGQIYWLSRNDDMIKKKGLRIFTTEIDEIVENKNKNIISKTILINEDLLLFYKGNSVKNDISKSIKENLPTYMHPFKIIKIIDFPLGPTGKIDVNKLKKDYASIKN
jgi:acyl-coenzyme A synthetase/AMP-(fatty) acid ligase